MTNRLTALFVFLAAGSVYCLTRAPGLSWQFGGTDGGELATAVGLGGIAHPSGYPLYVILGKVFTSLIFFESPASALTLFSTVTMAVGMVFLYAADSKLLPGANPVMISSCVLTLAFLPFTWSQAVIVEVYSFTFMFWTLILWQTSSLAQHFRPSKGYFLALVAGLGLGSHLILLLGLPGVVVWMLAARPSLRWRDVFLMGGLFLLGAGIYVWLPLRAGMVPVSNWGNPDNWERFRQHISGEIYHVYQFKGDYTENLVEWIKEIGRGFGPLLLFLPLGLGDLWIRHRPFLLGSFISAASIGFYRLGYAAEGVNAYWLLPNALLVIWISAGVQRWFQFLDRRLMLIILIFPLVQLAAHFNEMNLRNDHEPENFIHRVLLPLPENAILLTGSERETFTLWYAIYVEKKRTDICVIDVRMVQWAWYVDNLAKQCHGLELEGFVTFYELVDALPEDRPLFSRFPIELTDRTIFFIEG
jgi:hypothetical protein